MARSGIRRFMTFSIDWQPPRPEWDRLFATVDHSNLLQTWSYGDAKRAAQGWAVQRGIVREAQAPCALVQVLRYPAAGRAGIWRINRGPLWLGPAPDDRQLAGVLRLIRQQARWWRGGIMMIAPEMPSNPQSLTLLREAGFWPRPAQAHRSLRIDLTLPSSALRSNLGDKWRNQLNKAHRAGVTIETDNSEASFDWLLVRYEEMMETRAFKGLPAPLVRHMWQQPRSPGELHVLRAVLRGTWIAAMLIFRHGTTSTALVAWTGAEGRKVNANNAIIWQAIAAAKASGSRWFDVGDVDDKGPPGLARWKRGLGGQEYELAGEFICM